MTGGNTNKGRIYVGRQAIPIVERIALSVPKSESRRLSAIAARLAADEPALSSGDFAGVLIESGLYDGPALLNRRQSGNRIRKRERRQVI
jgi:hypothetical protein